MANIRNAKPANIIGAGNSLNMKNASTELPTGSPSSATAMNPALKYPSAQL